METTNQTHEDKDHAEIMAKVPIERDEQSEETPAAPEPPKPEETKPEPPPPVETPAPKAEEAAKPNRPEKYIPIAQYTDEKRQWRETEDGYKQRISELETIAKGNPEAKSTDARIKAYAEKYGVDEAAVRDLMALRGDEIASKPSDLSEAQQAELAKAREVNAEKAFTDEFDQVAAPQLKEMFPNATPEQLAAAKEELRSLATTAPFLDKSLDFIAFKSREALASHFKEDRVGPEGARPATRGTPHYSPSDFKDGKTSFKVLDGLPMEDRDRIIRGFDVKTYDEFVHHITQTDELKSR
jgi:hypothetical protein